MLLDARIADHRQGVARSPAIRVVIDDDIHGLPHAALFLGDDAPSDWPISVSFVRSDALSRLATGDRKSVVYGKRVSVRVDLGARRFINKRIIRNNKTPGNK